LILNNHNIDINEQIFFYKQKIYIEILKRRVSFEEINFDLNEINYRIVREDFGFIFSNLKNDFKYYDEINVRKQKTYINVSYDGTQNSKLFQINFYQVIKFYDKIYKKLQNVSTELGGLFNSFIFLGKMLILPIKSKNFVYNIINNIFNENDKNEIKKNRNLLIPWNLNKDWINDKKRSW